ncbi:MAG: hypothetical protein ACR2NS_12850 [Gemmatimonadaceae bacterium]
MKEKEIEYTVDGELQKTNTRTLTPAQILTNAGIDAGTHYLVLVKGKEKESYKDKADTPIHMHDGMKFVSVFVGSMTVS